MEINTLFGIVEPPLRADKSAMGAINRPLRRIGVVCSSAALLPYTFVCSFTFKVLETTFKEASEP
jgi:hypothetical protein